LERAGEELGMSLVSRERDFGRTPLMEAAHKGHWGTVAALLGAWYGACGGVSLERTWNELVKSWG
jgi:hypothetical protein